MDSAVSLDFLTQAESFLPTIRGGILVCAQEGNSYGALNASLRQVGSIKAAAAKLNLSEIVNSTENLEKNLSTVIEAKQNLDDEQSRRILDQLTGLEILLAQMRFAIDDSTISVADFVEESFDNLWLSQKTPALPAPPVLISETRESTAAAEEEFEIDEEMLEIFSLEAEELVQSIGDNLKILDEAPNDREALLEIRRNAHTLKGSAGIVGLNQLSKVAHRVEDMLDYVADNDIEANEKIFALLLTATDCFSALANNEKSPNLEQKINRLYEEFDETLHALKNQGAGDSTASEFSAPEPQIVNQTFEGAANETLTTNEDDAAENLTAPHLNSQRSIVRVSLEKLDDLVKIVGGLVVSRSVFEQRLTELEQQIGEIHNSTRRLQQSTNKLETNFEANMLNVQSPKSIGSPYLTGIASSVRRSLLVSQTSPVITDANAFDTLELDRYTDFHQTMRELIETTSDTSAINAELDNLHANLEQLFGNQRRLIEDMQDKILRLRLVTFGALSVRLRRTIRVACDEENKLAELFIEGENLEVDTHILDSLIEPLLHLLRNAVAHGIEPPETRRLLGKPETGKITVRARSEGTHIILKICDDGRGIFADGLKEKALRNGLISQTAADRMSDEEAFSLIFLPGLTTTGKISQISGRGVGMNIVKQSIERQQGTISIDSETHQGTTFTLRLPMALAVTRVLLIKTNEQTFAFPLKIIKQAIEVSATDLQIAGEKNRLSVGSANYAPVYLSELLNLPAPNFTSDETVPVLLLETLEKPCALIVGEIVKSEEIVIKPLGSPLQNIAELLGATILGDGGIVPVLDLIHLLERKLSNAEAKTTGKASKASERTAKSSKAASIARPTVDAPPTALNVLIVDDSPSVRHLTSNIIKNAGWNAIVAKDGLEALGILQDLREMPDIILSDVEMPRMDGYEFLASLKRQENLQKIPVVMITSRANQKHRQKAFDLGVSEYLIKPFDDAKLIETIKNLTA